MQDKKERDDALAKSTVAPDNPALDFVHRSKDKLRIIGWIFGLAVVCHIFASTLKYMGADKIVVGSFHVLEIAAIITDVIWIIILMIHEIAAAITEMLRRRLAIILFAIVVFVAGVVLGPYLGEGLLYLLEALVLRLKH